MRHTGKTYAELGGELRVYRTDYGVRAIVPGGQLELCSYRQVLELVRGLAAWLDDKANGEGTE